MENAIENEVIRADEKYAAKTGDDKELFSTVARNAISRFISEKNDLSYEDLIINIFKILIDIYGIDNAIILIYEINKSKGVKI